MCLESSGHLVSREGCWQFDPSQNFRYNGYIDGQFEKHLKAFYNRIEPTGYIVLELRRKLVMRKATNNTTKTNICV